MPLTATHNGPPGSPGVAVPYAITTHGHKADALSPIASNQPTKSPQSSSSTAAAAAPAAPAAAAAGAPSTAPLLPAPPATLPAAVGPVTVLCALPACGLAGFDGGAMPETFFFAHCSCCCCCCCVKLPDTCWGQSNTPAPTAATAAPDGGGGCNLKNPDELLLVLLPGGASLGTAAAAAASPAAPAAPDVAGDGVALMQLPWRTGVEEPAGLLPLPVRFRLCWAA